VLYICPDHGENKGKQVYGGQLLLADPSHKKEFAIWEEMLRRLTEVPGTRGLGQARRHG
jgi:hypothetical protein